MKGDFTRFTFKPRKHYTSVLMQQGRVQLDADWNEQADIHAYFNQSIAQDMIGASGAVKDEVREGVESRDSFEINTIPADADLIIAPGHFYVDGILCELDFGTPFAVTEKTNNQTNNQSHKIFAVNSLIVDGRSLEVGQWVEILDEKNQPIKKQLQINTVDQNQNLLSFAGDVSNDINKLRRVITYKTQPDYPQALQTDIELESDQKPPETYYLAYLDVWQRHITAIEDTNIREVALNGNDTTTRTQTVWQVKLHKIPDLTKEQANRELAIQKWQQDLNINHSPVYLTAKIKEGNQNRDNQLYRVEIHQPGKLGIASFKWSKNNGSTVFPIKEIFGNQISLNNPSRDASQSFTAKQLVEITDDARELQGKPGTLVQLKGAVRDKLTFDPTTVEGKPIDSNNFPQKYHPKVRAWDGMTKNATVSIDGIEVNFSAESEQDGDIVYRTGDYWLIPTRKVKVNGSNLIGDFGSALPQTPTGVEHHYSPLALLYYDREKFNLEEDLRSTFAPLSRALDKAGGIITGKLEIQDNLYITGKNIPTQDNSDTKFIPGKVRIGTEISQGKHLRAEPDARLHLQGTPPTSLSVEPSENGTIKVSTDSEEKLKVGDTITITPLNAGNTLTSIVTQVENDNSGANQQSLKVFPEFTAIPPSTFSYQQPIMLLADYENKAKIIVNSLGNLGIGTTTPHQQLVVNNGGKVAIGYNEANQSAALAIQGNVGIGTATPQQTLVILGKDDNNARVAIGYNQTAQTAALAINGNVGIGYSQVPQTTALAINSKVGIGTKEPEQTLVILGKDDNNARVGIGYNDTAQTAALAIQGNVGIGYSQVPQTTALAINSKVGIGTKEPEQTLVILGKDDNNARVGIGYNDTAQTAALAIQGNVGIGTATPQQTLVILSKDDNKGRVGIGYNDTAQTAALAINGNVGIGYSQVPQTTALAINSKVGIGTKEPEQTLVILGKDDNNARVGIGYNDTAQTAALAIQGNVGIGTATPQQTLVILGKDDNNARVGIGYNDTSQTAALAIDGNVGIGYFQVPQTTALAINGKVSVGTTELHQDTRLGIVGSTTIGSSSHVSDKAAPLNGLLVEGKVNIGETPQNNSDAIAAQLYVNEKAYINDELKVNNNTFLATRTGNQVTIGTERKPHAATILGIAGRTSIGSSSFINTKNVPANGLLVQGKINIGDTPKQNQQATAARFYTRGDAYIDGTFFAKTIAFNESFQNSSQQSKDDIIDLANEESLQLLETLRPVKYRYNTDETQQIHAGFIAEQSPDLFTSPDKTMLNSTGVIAVLTNVLKQQQEEIAKLQERVTTLERKHTLLVVEDDG